MTYWRMQLHPSTSGEPVKRAVQSLAARYIGLGFGADVGDLMLAEQRALPEQKKDYWRFAHEMRERDKVLIIAHHFPFALATVDSAYNYLEDVVPELGVWFRHFRTVKDVRHYADYVTNARSWDQIRMTDTISPLRDPKSKSFQLISEWSRVG